MFRIKTLLVCLSLLTAFEGKSKGENFVFTENCITAYEHILALRIQKGEELLALEKKNNPKSPAIAFIEDYSYFLRSFINEDARSFKEEIDDFEKRLDLIEDSDENSPFHRYCQAEMLIHQAALRFKFRNYVDGAANLRSAYKLLDENIKKHPSFKPQYKSMGMLEVMVGTVPESYSWVVSALGMDGDIDGGMKKIESFMNAPASKPEIDMLKDEGLFIYSFLQLHIVKEKEEAWKKVELATRDYKENLLHCYIRASIGTRCKKTDEVIQTLSNRPKGPDYIKFYFLEYMLGNAKLNRLDDGAAIHFKIFVTFFKGENYFKDAYLKLAWCSLLQNNTKEYNNYLSLIKSRGKNNFEEDKQAMKWAEADAPVNLSLLKGRLLFDGGYLEKALNEFKTAEKSDSNTEKDKLEVLYRMGRAYDEQKSTGQALVYYLETIKLGESKTWYFAANSALHAAMIYEDQKNCSKAKEYYNKVLKMPNEEYRQGIQGRAKAGLKRCEK